MDTTAGTLPGHGVELLDPAAAHRHTPGCWWDHDRCGWVCPAPAAMTTTPGRPGNGPQRR